MARAPAPRAGNDARLVPFGGAAGVAGGLAWVIKGVSILVLDQQPPLTFDIALPLFGLNLVGVALLTARGVRRAIALGLAWLAVVAGVVAVGSELLDRQWDPSIAASAVALLLAQLTLPRAGSSPATLAFWVGVGTLPALAVGGALAEIDEQLLEIPLVCLGLAWMLVGWATLRDRGADPGSPPTPAGPSGPIEGQ